MLQNCIAIRSNYNKFNQIFNQLQQFFVESEYIEIEKILKTLIRFGNDEELGYNSFEEAIEKVEEIMRKIDIAKCEFIFE